MNRYLYLIFTILICSCKHNSQSKNVQKKQCTLQQIEHNILQLKKVVQKSNYIDSITDKSKGISIKVDSILVDKELEYIFDVGYNNSFRFETYYTFTANKNDCSLKVYDKLSGEYISTEKWKESKKGNLLISKKGLKKIRLPFNYSQFYKDYFEKDYEEKYPLYKPSQELIHFLSTKDYEGENYKCYVLTSNEKVLNFVVSISRGDSTYYLLVTSQLNKVINFIEIGAIGGEDIITFNITKDLIIRKYKGSLQEGKLFEQYQIINNTLINKI